MPASGGASSSKRDLAQRLASAGKSALVSGASSSYSLSSRKVSAASAQTRLRKAIGRRGAAVEDYTTTTTTDSAAAANSSVKSKKHYPSVSVQVEYWNGHRWKEDGNVTVSKNSVTLFTSQTAIKFNLSDTPLRIEHSKPLSRDFNIILVGSAGRHRVAVYSEGEGLELVSSLAKLGAQVIQRRALPPCTLTRGKSNQSLRPISEGEALMSSNMEYSRHESKSRRRVSRRKSTGSSDSGPTSGEYEDHDHHHKVHQVELLPRSSSLSLKEHRGSKSIWYRDETSRGLSTGSTKKKKVHSDQSLNSDEVSTTGSSTNGDAVFYYDEDTSSGSATDDDQHDGGGVFRLGERLAAAASSSSKRSSSPETSPGWQRKTKAAENNEKLDKFKFLLVNIEEDEDILDPGEFGASGDFVSCDFDDYPDEIFDKDPSSLVEPSSNLGEQVPSWIRKSFEELELDVNSTKYDRSRRSSTVSGGSAHSRASLQYKSGNHDRRGSSSSKKRLLLRQTSSVQDGNESERPQILFSDNDQGTEV